MARLKCRMCGKIFTEKEINDSIKANTHYEFPKCESPEAGVKPFVDSGIGGHLLREVKPEPLPPRCKSCRKPLSKHMGLQGTCARLLECEAELKRLRTLLSRKAEK